VDVPISLRQHSNEISVLRKTKRVTIYETEDSLN
jgi:hypothetical protein